MTLAELENASEEKKVLPFCAGTFHWRTNQYAK